jgi:hypothetical protein
MDEGRKRVLLVAAYAGNGPRMNLSGMDTSKRPTAQNLGTDKFDFVVSRPSSNRSFAITHLLRSVC